MTFHSRLEYLLITLLAGSLTLAGCSTVGGSAEPSAAQPQVLTTEAVADIPARPLSEQQLELLLEAELSAFRQNGERATELYVEAAEQTRDIGVITRGIELAMAFGEDEAALSLAQIWREVEPGLMSDRFAAQFFARVGETEAAWELAHPLDDEGTTLRIVAAESLGLNDPDRLIWLDNQMATLPNPGYQLWIGRALLRDALNDLDNASELARQAYLLKPQEIITAELYASLLARQERDADLELLLNSWLLAYWSGESSQIRVARMATQLPLDRAIHLLQNVITQRSNTQELVLLLGQAYLNLPDADRAEALFRSLLDQPDYSDVAQYRLAQVAELRSQFEQAVQAYGEVNPGPWFGPANQRAGEILLSTDSQAGLNQHFQQQRMRHPEASEQLYLIQAGLLNEIGANQAVYDLATTALQITPDQYDLLYLRSLAADRLGMHGQAEADLRHILTFDPNNSQVLNALGYHLTERTDRYEEAYGLIRQALTQDPENAAIIDSMGWVLFKLGHHEEAALYLQEALNRFYNDEVIVHLVEALLALGRNQEALELMQEALGNLPDSQLLRDAEQRLNFSDLES